MDCESLGAAAYVGLTHPSHHITRTVSSCSYVGTYGLAVGLYLYPYFLAQHTPTDRENDRPFKASDATSRVRRTTHCDTLSWRFSALIMSQAQVSRPG